MRLTVRALLDDLHFTRSKVRVLANNRGVRDRLLPFDRLTHRLRTDDDNFIDWVLGALPIAVLVLLFSARLTLSLDLVGALFNVRVVLVHDLERHLTRGGILHIHRCSGVVLGAVLIGHDDRDIDLIARLRGFRRGRNNVAPII